MKPIVSKARTRKTRTRAKQAGKAASQGKSLQENRLIGVFIGFLLWVLVLLVMGLEQMAADDAAGSVFPIIGRGTFLLVGLFVSAMFLRIARPGLLRQNTTVLLLCLISFITIAAARPLLFLAETTALFDLQVVRFLLPIAAAPLLATILVDGVAGTAVGFWTTLAIATFARGSFSLFCSGMVATVVCADTAEMVRTRSKVLRIGLMAGISKIVCVFGLTAFNWAVTDVVQVLYQVGACIVSGFFSAIAVLLILPLFEWMFRITTNITLLELSDLGHPLLQRLAIEAPGTYHHSLVVANLAQAAADEIGANSLLARVCSYFHDIGKLVKPQFFGENLQMRANPHDDLPPSMSTLVITSHVKEGLSLAVLHRLPDPIIETIREHHGTSLLSYFHHKASAEVEVALTGKETAPANGQPKVDEGAFRYDGPKPTTRESAIINLADAVEAASRSMEKTTPSHIEGLVGDIVEARLADGQLDNCDLTLRDLVTVRNAFVFTLSNMLHGRVAYPKDESRDKQQSKHVPGRPKGNKAADTVPDGTRKRGPRSEGLEGNLRGADGQPRDAGD
jgi:putative nucleotidyltransferase with HDIG domain